MWRNFKTYLCDLARKTYFLPGCSRIRMCLERCPLGWISSIASEFNNSSFWLVFRWTLLQPFYKYYFIWSSCLPFNTHKTKDCFLRRCQDPNKNKSCCLPKTEHLQTLGKGQPDVLITVINTMMRLDKERVDFSLQPSGHTSSLREARAETWGQDQGPLVDKCTCCFASHKFLSLLSYTVWDHFVRFRTINNSLVPLTFIKKIINH